MTVGAGGATIELLQYFNSSSIARRARFIIGEVKFFDTISNATAYNNPLFEIKLQRYTYGSGWGSGAYNPTTAIKVGEVDLPAGTYVVRTGQQIIEYSQSVVQPRMLIRKKT